jgi:hypothetical protein
VNTTTLAVRGQTRAEWTLDGAGRFSTAPASPIWLWRNTSTGANTIWRAGKHEHAHRRGFAHRFKPWKISAWADFDGDGKSRICSGATSNTGAQAGCG